MWANKVLRDYLVKGYSVGTKELTNEESRGLLDIVADYSYALDILDQYDYQTLRISDTTLVETYHLSYEEAIEKIRNVRMAYGNSELFGREKDESLKSSIGTIYQTFGGKDLYPSVEEKAANNNWNPGSSTWNDYKLMIHNITP